MSRENCPEQSRPRRGQALLASSVLTAIMLVGVGLEENVERPGNAESKIQPGIPGEVIGYRTVSKYCAMKSIFGCMSRDTAYQLLIMQCPEGAVNPPEEVCVIDRIDISKSMYDGETQIGAIITVGQPGGEPLVKINRPESFEL